MREQTILSAVIWCTVGLVLPPVANSQMKARVAWTSFASNMSGSWVAREEGLFKKNGLEVELVHIPSTSRSIQTLLAGELAYTYMDGRTAVQATLKGADAVIVAGVANRLVFSFMARPEIKSFNDLKGKKIGITRLGSSTHSVTLWVMNRFGLKAEDYQLLQLVDVPNIFTAMMAGQIDAGALSPPTNFRGRKAGADGTDRFEQGRTGIRLGRRRLNPLVYQEQRRNDATFRSGIQRRCSVPQGE